MGWLRPTTARAENPPAWQTALTSATSVFGSINSQAAATDANGNVFVVGNYTGTVRLGATTLTSTAGTISIVDSEIFVAKWNPRTGDWVWAVRAGGTYGDQAVAVAVSGSAIYITGSCSPIAKFGNQTLRLASNYYYNYVAELVDTGDTAIFAWVRGASNATNVQHTGIAASNGNVYVAGNFKGTTTFDGVTLTSADPDYNDAFVLRFADEGQATVANWGRRAGGTRDDVATGIAASGDNVYLAGAFTSATADFGGTVLTNTRASYSDAFVTRLTDRGTTGTFAWAKQVGGTFDERATAVVASGPNVYVGGKTGSATASFDGLALPGTLNLFVAKLQDTGGEPAYTWVQQAGGGNADLRGLAVAGSSLYVTGQFSNGPTPTRFGATSLTNPNTFNDVFVARLDDAGATASYDWAQPAGGTDIDLPTGIAASSAGIFVAGTTSSSLVKFGTPPVRPLYTGAERSVSHTNSFVAALAPNGTWQAAQQGFIGGGISVESMAVDACGMVYLAGGFTGQVELGGTLLGSLGSSDIFVAKWNPVSSSWTWVVRAGGEGGENNVHLAANGPKLYLVGTLSNASGPLATPSTAEFGSFTLTNSNLFDTDAFVAKLTDTGTTGVFDWVERIGGVGNQALGAVAVSGNSLYVAGKADGLWVDFGPTRITNRGGFDALVGKLTDLGSSASYNWALGTGDGYTDDATSLAVSGSNIYIAGGHTNPYKPNLQPDIMVAKVVDAGATATFGWTQFVPAIGRGYATALAARGANVYVTGTITDPTISFGTIVLASPTPDIVSIDGFVARLTDAGARPTWGWAQRMGGPGTETPSAIALSGNGVYVTGSFTSTPATFGPVTIKDAVSNDGFIAKLIEYGATTTFDWVQRTGGPGTEIIHTLAVSGNQLTVGGNFRSDDFTLGTISVPGGPVGQAFAARLTDYALVDNSAAFSYDAPGYCRTAANPTPGVAGTAGGTFSASPATGLSLNATTGTITISASTPGTYMVTYTLPGRCGSSSSQAVTITAPASAGFAYGAASYCTNAGASPAPTLSAGATAGTFSSSAGLVLSPTTGLITLAGSAPGTYLVTNTVAASGGCAAVMGTASVTITAAAVANLAYPAGGQLCQNGALVLPTSSGTKNGTFSAVPGTGLALDPETGVITPGSSTPGTYVVTYAVGTACPASSSQMVTVVAPPAVPTLSASGTAATGITLTASPGTSASYQFYRNGVLVAGNTGPTLLVGPAAAVGSYTVTATNAAGCVSARSAPLAVVLAATASATSGPALRVYPNPSPTGQLTLELTGYRQGATLAVYNATGQQVLAQQLSAAAARPVLLHLAQLPTGVYLLRVASPGQVLTQRLTLN